MYNNKAYYSEQLKRALADAEDRLSEAGPDFLNVVMDALNHMEGAIDEGFKPWEDYGEPMYPFTVVTADNGVFEVWAEDMEDASKAACEKFTGANIRLIKRS
jgi:hypothetical protein